MKKFLLTFLTLLVFTFTATCDNGGQQNENDALKIECNSKGIKFTNKLYPNWEQIEIKNGITFKLFGADTIIPITGSVRAKVINSNTTTQYDNGWVETKCDTPLPLMFYGTKAYINNGNLVVIWNSLTEFSVKHYIVKVSENGKSWQNFATVESKGFGTNVYSLNKPLTGALFTGMFVTAIFAFKRRRNWFITSLFLLLFVIACRKNYHKVKDIPNINYAKITAVDGNGSEMDSPVMVIEK